MIELLKPTKKQLQKLKKVDSTIVIPDNWIDFVKNCKIRSGGNIINFNPYDYQIKLVELMIESSVVIVKSRQLGISETISSFMLYKACKNEGYLGLVFSKTQKDSSLLARRILRMIESLGLNTKTENLSDIELKKGGRLLFRNSRPDSARGIESVCDVFLDELAFIENSKEIWDAVAPSQQMVGDAARVYAVSTPNGKEGLFYDLISSSNNEIDILDVCDKVSKKQLTGFQNWKDEGGWNKIVIHWTIHPIYGTDPDFLKKVALTQKLSSETIEKEYNLNFSESETQVFSNDLILKNSCGNFEKPIENSTYFIGIDAVGSGNDYCAAVVLKLQEKTYSLVKIYRENKKTSETYLNEISKLITDYKPLEIGIESTGGYGQIWLETLSRKHYDYKFKKIVTTQDSKKIGIERLKIKLEFGNLIFPYDSELTKELSFFKNHKNKFTASKGKHDDVIMATTFALTIGDEYD